MSAAEESKRVIRRYYEDLQNKWDLSLVDEIIAPNAVLRASFGVINGRGDVIDYFTRFHAAFPDFYNDLHAVIAEGDEVAVHLTVTGTHAGEFCGVAPTGKRIAFSGIALHRIADGQMAEGTISADTLGFMKQLGVVDPPDLNLLTR
jgi:steroid delta-isomerase-like uncharacterized protein